MNLEQTPNTLQDTRLQTLPTQNRSMMPTEKSSTLNPMQRLTMTGMELLNCVGFVLLAIIISCYTILLLMSCLLSYLMATRNHISGKDSL